MPKKLIVTMIDNTTKEINIDLLQAALNIPIGAKPDHPGYMNFAMDCAASGFVDPDTKGTDHPEIIAPSQIKRVRIDLGRNLSYEQEFLNKE